MEVSLPRKRPAPCPKNYSCNGTRIPEDFYVHIKKIWRKADECKLKHFLCAKTYCVWGLIKLCNLCFSLLFLSRFMIQWDSTRLTIGLNYWNFCAPHFGLLSDTDQSITYSWRGNWGWGRIRKMYEVWSSGIFLSQNKSLEGEDDFDKATLHLNQILTLRLHCLRPEQFIFQSYSSKLIRTPAQSVSSKSTEFYISSWSYQHQSSSSSKTLTKTRQNTGKPSWSWSLLLSIRSKVQILNHPVAILKKSITRTAPVNIIHEWWTERLTLKREKESTLWIWMEFRKGGIAQPWYFISKSPFDFQWREISHNPDILPAQVFRQRGVSRRMTPQMVLQRVFWHTMPRKHLTDFCQTL